jgi:hypothetical protein
MQNTGTSSQPCEDLSVDGETKIWRTRLNQALGTRASDFVNASLFQLHAAARLASGGLSEMALNATLAMMEGATPRE